jgi:hypothetical protein
MESANKLYFGGNGSFNAFFVVPGILEAAKNNVEYTGGVKLRFYDWVDLVREQHEKDPTFANELVYYMYNNEIYLPTKDDLLWLGENHFTYVLVIAKKMRINLPEDLEYALQVKKQKDFDALLSECKRLQDEMFEESRKRYKVRNFFAKVLEQINA